MCIPNRQMRQFCLFTYTRLMKMRCNAQNKFVYRIILFVFRIQPVRVRCDLLSPIIMSTATYKHIGWNLNPKCSINWFPLLCSFWSWQIALFSHTFSYSGDICNNERRMMRCASVFTISVSLILVKCEFYIDSWELKRNLKQLYAYVLIIIRSIFKK